MWEPRQPSVTASLCSREDDAEKPIFLRRDEEGLATIWAASGGCVARAGRRWTFLSCAFGDNVPNLA